MHDNKWGNLSKILKSCTPCIPKIISRTCTDCTHFSHGAVVCRPRVTTPPEWTWLAWQAPSAAGASCPAPECVTAFGEEGWIGGGGAAGGNGWIQGKWRNEWIKNRTWMNEGSLSNREWYRIFEWYAMWNCEVWRWWKWMDLTGIQKERI